MSSDSLDIKCVSACPRVHRLILFLCLPRHKQERVWRMAVSSDHTLNITDVAQKPASRQCPGDPGDLAPWPVSSSLTGPCGSRNPAASLPSWAFIPSSLCLWERSPQLSSHSPGLRSNISFSERAVLDMFSKAAAYSPQLPPRSVSIHPLCFIFLHSTDFHKENSIFPLFVLFIVCHPL